MVDQNLMLTKCTHICMNKCNMLPSHCNVGLGSLHPCQLAKTQKLSATVVRLHCTFASLKPSTGSESILPEDRACPALGAATVQVLAEDHVWCSCRQPMRKTCYKRLLVQPQDLQATDTCILQPLAKVRTCKSICMAQQYSQPISVYHLGIT